MSYEPREFVKKVKCCKCEKEISLSGGLWISPISRNALICGECSDKAKEAKRRLMGGIQLLGS